jgi:hypothetical protein
MAARWSRSIEPAQPEEFRWAWRQQRLHLGTSIAEELGESKNPRLAIVSKDAGVRCKATVAFSTRFTATIA